MIIGFKQVSEKDTIINVNYADILDYCLFILQTTSDIELKCGPHIPNSSRIKDMHDYSFSTTRGEISLHRKNNAGKMEKVINLN